ncbi:MAG: DNA translocase FtsK, partial [Chlamydiia bacterium]|nr:DNA translocase FtsK [Chlamydiia bacterium]
GLIGYALGFAADYLFGLSAFLIPCYLLWLGYHFVLNRPIPYPRLSFFSFVLLLTSLGMLLSYLTFCFPNLAHRFKAIVYTDTIPDQTTSFLSFERTYLGGVPFYHVCADAKTFNFISYFGNVGALLLFVFLLGSSLLFITRTPPQKVGHWFFSFCKFIFSARQKEKAALVTPSHPFKGDHQAIFERPLLINSPPIRQAMTTSAPQMTLPKPPTSTGLSGYQLPPSSLLTEVKIEDQNQLASDLKRHANVLEETLLSFGIEAKVGDIHSGPTITLFEVHPAIGVKVQKIKALERDIALNMQAKSIRIIAPIPGKAAVGIEVPNPHPQEVSFRRMLENYQGSKRKFQIPLLLGQLVGGEDMASDLTKCPHLIIAGATGSGKSVSINTIVMSIVMNARPDEIKLLMVDPKKVELTGYSQLPHMLAPVITEAHGARQALLWLVKEMEKRYELFRRFSIRNVIGYNTRKRDRELEETFDEPPPKKLPYIVVIIDELADLMMISSSDIETPIARIAQMARAVGIHMILATQRPSREVITGLIKANFPSRIAFKVSSRVNSQIIIDETGAESLLGNGDMLFLPPGTSNLMRAQGAFIRDEDINRVIEFVTAQMPVSYLIPSFDTYRDEGELPTGFEHEEETKDALYGEAKKLVIETGAASTTFLQRKLKIGYARAASLMDQLESMGIITPQEGAKPRRVIYTKEEEKEEEQL